MTHKIPAPIATIIAAVTLGAQQAPAPPITPPIISTPSGAAAVEQRTPGTRPPAALIASFDGLGVGFTGPQGTASVRQPSDNSLAVGPDHIVQTVNSRMAIFTKRGSRFDTTGRVLYGPVATNNVFRGFGGTCEARNNGDAVARYDQLANRWLIVMPIFRRAAARPDQPGVPDARTVRVGVEPDGWSASERAYISPPGRSGQPGPAVALFQPEPPPDEGQSPAPSPQPRPDPNATGLYSMCYAISTGPDPFGPYYRYEFLRPLFPDYPRPAVWPDGYYVPTSTGDDVIQKHTCIVDRAKMLKGEPATEQCLIVDGVNFLNNADLDGTQLPPAGAPNVMMAAGGTQLKGVYEDERILAWNVHVDWNDPSKTRLAGPTPIRVAPYRYIL